MPGRDFTTRDRERIAKMAAQGLTVSEIACALSPVRTSGSIRTFCLRAGIPVKLAHFRSHDNAGTRVNVPAEVIAERDARLAAYFEAAAKDANISILGDPYPARSALHAAPRPEAPRSRNCHGNIMAGISRYG
jgi:hypothetical protein